MASFSKFWCSGHVSLKFHFIWQFWLATSGSNNSYRVHQDVQWENPWNALLHSGLLGCSEGCIFMYILLLPISWTFSWFFCAAQLRMNAMKVAATLPSAETLPSQSCRFNEGRICHEHDPCCLVSRDWVVFSLTWHGYNWGGPWNAI